MIQILTSPNREKEYQNSTTCVEWTILLQNLLVSICAIAIAFRHGKIKIGQAEQAAYMKNYNENSIVLSENKMGINEFTIIC